MRTRSFIAILGAIAVAALAVITVNAPPEGDPNPRAHISSWATTLACVEFNVCPTHRNNHVRARIRRQLINSVNVGFTAPLRAEPEPTPKRQDHAATILQCTYADFDQLLDFEFETEPGRAWQEGEAPPDSLLRLAESDNAQAQWELGWGLLSSYAGSNYATTEQEAFNWVVRAAENGHPVARTEVGSAHVLGYFGSDFNWSYGRRLLRESASEGDALALLALALAPPEDGQPLTEYGAERLDLELASANACYRDAAILIAARLLETDRGLKQDVELADQIFQRVSGVDLETGEPLADAEPES